MRFPEFTGEWEKYRNETLFQTISEKNKDKSITKILSASQQQGMVERDSLGLDIKFDYDSISSYKIVRKGDYVIHLRSFQGGFAFSEQIGVCSPAYTILRPSPMISYGFLKYHFVSNKFIDALRIVTYGIRDGRSISVEEWLKLYTSLPKAEEQNKIIQFLNLIDKRIATQIRVIDKLESLIKGITQKVCSNAEQKVMLTDVLVERDEKNTENNDVYSVSVTEGVINQIDYLGRSFAAKETKNYNVVHYGDIVYTKSPTGAFPYGIVKQSYIASNVAVSPLYGVYKPINFNTGFYLHQYFTSPIYTTNYLHKLIQKGAKNTINITNQRFLENYVPFPSTGVLIKYVDIVSAINKKLAVEKQILYKLKEQKNYLLSQMFI